MKKKICIIYTGGTIGMVQTEKGFAPLKGNLQTVMKSFPDFNDPNLPDWDIVEFDTLLDSSNIALEEWNMMGRMIAENYDDYDGFVLIHGTDTMAFTASALSFMLEGLDKPVILTGSQIPLCVSRSDGRDNLLSSLLLAADGMIDEVCIFFGGRLYRGNRTTKISADDLRAFDSPNKHRLADMAIGIKYYVGAIKEKEAESFDSFHLFELKDTAVAILKVVPGMHYDNFRSLAEGKFDAIIFEVFGAGNIPSDEKLLDLIRKAAKNDVLCIVRSQCSAGSVSLGSYEAGDVFVAAGAVSAYDMTTETILAKVHYLHSKGLGFEETKKQMETSLRGELTIR